MKPGLRKDSLGHIIAARDESGNGLSDEQLAANAAIFLFAGMFHFIFLVKIKVSIPLRLLLHTLHMLLRKIQIFLMSLRRKSPDIKILIPLS
jgi:hypothetical protein